MNVFFNEKNKVIEMYVEKIGKKNFEMKKNGGNEKMLGGVVME